MTKCRLLWHDYRYFPYERSLAARELAQLAGQEPYEAGGCLVLASDSGLGRLRRATYFKGIEAGDQRFIPDQALLEASSLANGQNWQPGNRDFPRLRRQSTRYSAHGLHEYKGKFHPQIVRAIGNLLGVEPGAWVFDPFCGSGTTLLEASHIGWHTLGIDINPLAILIANAKIKAFRASPAILSRECAALAGRLTEPSCNSDWREHLPEPEYLQKWFSSLVLQQLHSILLAIEKTRPKAIQDVFRVILSDIVRDVSLQDPSDLRIRRRKNPEDNYPATQMFLDSMRAKVASIVQARCHVRPKRDVQQLAILADARRAAVAARRFLSEGKRKGFDCAITSPPYATAMPYLDTQRLSLSLFGLIESRDLRSEEKTLIGNREIQGRERAELEDRLRSNSDSLPEEAIKFCRGLLDLADDNAHGFRRRNVPALLYKYLADMSTMFGSVREMILPGLALCRCLCRSTGRTSPGTSGESFNKAGPKPMRMSHLPRFWQTTSTGWLTSLLSCCVGCGSGYSGRTARSGD